MRIQLVSVGNVSTNLLKKKKRAAKGQKTDDKKIRQKRPAQNICVLSCFNRPFVASLLCPFAERFLKKMEGDAFNILSAWP